MTLQIRHAVPEDHPAVTRVFEGPKAVWGTLQLPHPSPDTWRKRLAEPEPGAIFLVAETGGEVVGIAGLHPQVQHARRRHAAHLGMTVRDDYQGQGIGTRLLVALLDLADNWLNLTRLELHVWVDNEPALKLYRRHGFEIEGTLRQHAFREGRFIDAHVMARLRPSPRPTS